jgi:3-phenylpropionate/trans-cinnamate dioxygenase ferredoxin reductase subunit
MTTRHGGVVVVGASLGGLRAAEQLRVAGYKGTITLISAEEHRPYNRPPLSKEVLRDGVAIDSLTLTNRVDLEPAEWLMGTTVVASCLSEGRVTLSNGVDLHYDGLVIASGLRPRRLPLGRGLAGMHALRTWDDAVAFRAGLKPGARLVVVGAGFIGCESAASAREAGCLVTVVAPETVPLERAVGSVMGAFIQGRHNYHGVQFRLGNGLTAISGTDRVESIELLNGEVLQADLVLEAVGSAPNVEWLDGNALDLSDGVLCDANMRVVGAERVVAVGDVARFPNHRFDNVPRRVEHWNIPVETAKRAARSLSEDVLCSERSESPFRPLPAFWSKQFDYRLQSYGMTGLADTVVPLDEEVGGLPIFSYERLGERVAVAAFGNTAQLVQLGSAIGGLTANA